MTIATAWACWSEPGRMAKIATWKLCDGDGNHNDIQGFMAHLKPSSHQPTIILNIHTHHLHLNLKDHQCHPEHLHLDPCMKATIKGNIGMANTLRIK